MPIESFTKIARFAARCGTKIPDWTPKLFADLEEAPEIHRLVAATVAAEQCRELAERGVQNFHFYTMNQPELSAAVCRILGLHPGAQAKTNKSASSDPTRSASTLDLRPANAS